MIRKYVYGIPFETESVVTEMEAVKGTPAYGTVCVEDGFRFACVLDEEDVVYGLGEQTGG